MTEEELQEIGRLAIGCARNLGAAMLTGPGQVAGSGMVMRASNGRVIRVAVSFVNPEELEDPLDDVQPILSNSPG